MYFNPRTPFFSRASWRLLITISSIMNLREDDSAIGSRCQVLPNCVYCKSYSIYSNPSEDSQWRVTPTGRTSQRMFSSDIMSISIHLVWQFGHFSDIPSIRTRNDLWPKSLPPQRISSPKWYKYCHVSPYLNWILKLPIFLQTGHSARASNVLNAPIFEGLITFASEEMSLVT